MSRKDEFVSSNPNPAQKWLEWKSDSKQLGYYDKATSENKLVPLPFSFLVLKEMHTVTGWHDNSGSGIYSNEVKFISQEEVDVKSYKGGAIKKGIYKEIKSDIQAAGGHYTKSIYAMTKQGTLINIRLKGSATQAWGDFSDKCRNRLTDEWVTLTGAEDRIKGKVSFSVPVFAFAGAISKEDEEKADAGYKEIDDFLKGAPAVPPREQEMAELASISDDDLPF